jgi:nitronate monooxygenase
MTYFTLHLRDLWKLHCRLSRQWIQAGAGDESYKTNTFECFWWMKQLSSMSEPATSEPSMSNPLIIQGGMGAGVSNWRLAQAVSRLGQLGLVSGTALDPILARRLQDGDPGGHMRRGLDAFPFPAMAERIWQKYYIAGGKAERTPYISVPQLEKDISRELIEINMVANFVEVYLARQGHSNPVGINYLEKIQMAHLSCIYGAMLAGVGYVVMGAGIPLKIPGVLDRYVNHEAAEYAIHIHGSQEGDR